jgi:mannose-6-phosphate isomerase class I
MASSTTLIYTSLVKSAMEIIRKEQSKKFQKDDITAYEYPSQNKNINSAYVEIRGRHPKEGFICNKDCTELIFIIRGFVTLTTEKESFQLQEKDQVIINPNEKYFLEGDCDVVAPSTPPWTPNQTEISK